MEKPIKLGPTQLVKVILSTLVIQNSMCAVTEGNCDNEFKLLANSDQNKNNGGSKLTRKYWFSVKKKLNMEYNEITRFLVSDLKYLRSQVPSDIQQETAQMAMKRILGPISHKISLKIDPSLTTSEYRDSFLVSVSKVVFVIFTERCAHFVHMNIVVMPCYILTKTLCRCRMMNSPDWY